MKKPKNAEQWKAELQSTEFEYMEVIEVFTKKKRLTALCKCVCGNEFHKDVHSITKTANCGCKKSEVYSKAIKKYISEHPEMIEQRAKAYKEWCSNNHERLKELGEAHSQWMQENADKVKVCGEAHSQWFKDNPEYVKSLSEKNKQWYKDNPEKVEIRSNNYKAYIKENPDKVQQRIDKYSNTYKSMRMKAFENYKGDYLHPEDLEKLKSGEFNQKSVVRSKCPLCGNYDSHVLNTFMDLKTADLLRNKPPLCKICYKDSYISSYEDEIYKFITSLGVECIRNTRDIISPLELDLYIPSHKLAIEFNGTYWHSFNKDAKYKEYHFNKFKACREKGIRLISIFEHVYNINSDKILTCIKNSLVYDKLYARQCIVKEVDKKTKKEFINKYHLNGDNHQGTIAYGLYYKDELVSCITFGKLRGQNPNKDKDGFFELVRFVTVPGMHIVGGLSKLLSKFIADNNPNYILCYSDNDYYTGTGYEKVGFKLKSLGEKSIDYQWVKGSDVLQRQQCMVFRLLKKYPEYNDIEIIGSKENYIMEDLGYLKIFKCGNSIWEWNKPSA